eukprot:7827137-Pyramimonas_sp.AAC.2
MPERMPPSADNTLYVSKSLLALKTNRSVIVYNAKYEIHEIGSPAVRAPAGLLVVTLKQQKPSDELAAFDPMELFQVGRSLVEASSGV